MFSIPTYIAPSAIAGTGVFTPCAIPQGARVWAFDPAVDWKLTPEELNRVPEPHGTRLRTYCYLDGEGLYVLCGDNARFMNHAEDPNCADVDGLTFAGRDIRAHEELTCDYRSFDQGSAACGPGPLFGGPKAE